MSKRKIEVELRALVTPNIIKKLNSESKKESREHDLYFRYKTDLEKLWIARIRSKGNKHVLTYKSNKKFGEGAWDEVNIPLGKEAAAQLASFFKDNEHNLEAEITKFRRTFKIDGMEVNIDEIDNLGTYIEAEIMAETEKLEEAKDKIKSFFKKLGITESNITEKGYVGLMRDKKNGITS